MIDIKPILAKGYVSLLCTTLALLFIPSSTAFGQDALKYKLTPKSAEYLEQAPHSIVFTDEIDAPIEDVWKVIKDCAYWTQWFPKMTSCETTDDGQLNASRQVQIGKRKFQQKIIIWEEKKAYGFTIIGANRKLFKSAVESVFLQAINENTTQITYKGGVKYAGMARFFPNVGNNQLLKTWKKAFASLKSFLQESSQ